MKKKVVFYYQDFPKNNYSKVFQKKLNKKKFNIIFTRDYKIPSDFGFYAEDANRVDQISSKVSSSLLVEWIKKIILAKFMA